MFLITNRRIRDGREGLDKFGSEPNPKGPNEIRIAEVHHDGQDWRVEVLKDQATPEQKAEVGLGRQRAFASEYAARRIFGQINPAQAAAIGIQNVAAEGKNLLFFVHGYNNNIEAVVRRANELTALYNVEVVAFSWPANGGGAKGVASYKSDKRDARASTGALDRTLARMDVLLRSLTEDFVASIRRQAERDHPNDPEARDRLVSRVCSTECPYTVNAMFHSMGNYVLKNMLRSDATDGNKLIFDNIVLAAADTNNEGHASWVDKLKVRKRVYVAINEDDGALKVSRMKSGDEQKARLGHYPKNLTAAQAVYVQCTDGERVGSSHAYFEDESLAKPGLMQFFTDAFNGRVAEGALAYDAATNMYLFPDAA